MNVFKRIIMRFKSDTSGQAMVEYGIILALVSIVAIGGMSNIGDVVEDKFGNVSDSISFSNVPDKGDGGILPDKGDEDGGEVEEEVDEELDEISKMIRDGFIPVATPSELNYLRDEKVQLFGEGTKWEGQYLSGLDKKFVQVLDIDMGEFGNFDPIGTIGKDKEFRGVYDGWEFVIRDLTVDMEGELDSQRSYLGLFGNAKEARLENIGLVNVLVKGKNQVGGLVGNIESGTVVSKCYSTGKVVGRQNVGGLVGNQKGHQNSLTRAESSYSACDVEETSERYITKGYNMGGLVGGSDEASIVNCYAIGNVTGTRHVGGLVGHLYNMSSIKDSACSKEISSKCIGGKSSVNAVENVNLLSISEVNKRINDLGITK